MNAQSWANENLGKGSSAENPLTPTPADILYGECVYGASSYSEAIGGPNLLGATAWDIWNNFTSSFYQKIPGAQPQANDIVFYEPNDAAVGTDEDGHVDVCTESYNGSTFQAADVNWNSDSNLQLVTHGMAGVAGVFRPTNQGEDMASLTNQNDVDSLYAELLGRAPASGEGANWVGIPWPTAYYGIAQSPEAVAFTEQVRKWQAGGSGATGTVLAPGNYVVE